MAPSVPTPRSVSGRQSKGTEPRRVAGSMWRWRAKLWHLCNSTWFLKITLKSPMLAQKRIPCGLPDRSERECECECVSNRHRKATGRPPGSGGRKHRAPQAAPPALPLLECPLLWGHRLWKGSRASGDRAEPSLQSPGPLTQRGRVLQGEKFLHHLRARLWAGRGGGVPGSSTQGNPRVCSQGRG